MGRAAFGNSIEASSVSNIDIGGILSNVANKFLLDGFFSVERTWRNICAVRNVSDFKTVTSYRLAAGEVGSLAVDGVFDFNKNTGVAFTVGTILYWDDTNNVVTTTSAGNKSIGKVVRAAASADTTVRMRLSQ